MDTDGTYGRKQRSPPGDLGIRFVCFVWFVVQHPMPAMALKKRQRGIQHEGTKKGGCLLGWAHMFFLRDFVALRDSTLRHRIPA
jgi:hypothetical protein